MTEEAIKEIADNLDMGNRCFLHKVSKEIKFIPDFDSFDIHDDELWEDELQFLEGDLDDFIEIEGMSSYQGFEVMKDFIDTVDDLALKAKLDFALQKSKPFRQFKIVIDDSGDYRQQWFSFKNNAYMSWVREQIESDDDILSFF